MSQEAPDLNLFTMHETPYGWPLRQLRIPKAHEVTRASAEVIVAVIDLGYVPHPDHAGHLWVNPNPTRGDVHGWDCHDDDGSLEPSGPNADTEYLRRHHAFVAGEVMACAPECKVMIVRVGYGNPDSWWKGIDYAVEHGAKVLVIPHGFLTHGTHGSKIPLFYRGTDFSYAEDNPQIRRALDEAYDAGCLTCRGVAENRGRRIAAVNAALDSVMAIGSSNRAGKAADICCSADYVEVAAPSGQRDADDEVEYVWSTGGGEGYTSSTGGCMAAGFGGGVAALVCSRFPDLSNEQVRQILRNTAGNDTWDDKLGWGILDAAKAVALKPETLSQKLRIDARMWELRAVRGKPVLKVMVQNRGAFDVERALLVAFSGDPRKAAAPRASMEKPQILITRQTGHAIGAVRGLHEAEFVMGLTGVPQGDVWLQVCVLDRHGSGDVDTVKIAAGEAQAREDRDE